MLTTRRAAASIASSPLNARLMGAAGTAISLADDILTKGGGDQ